MLDLSSSQWNQLQHAYGTADDIPPLLRQLEPETAPTEMRSHRDEPWFSLWSALCHQGDVYSASYVAVPHIVRIATLKSPSQRSDFVLLATCIEIARHRSKTPAISDELSVAYFNAMEELRALIIEYLQMKLKDESDAKIFLSGLAATSDLPNLGNAILELPSPNVCPNCDTDVPPSGYDLE